MKYLITVQFQNIDRTAPTPRPAAHSASLIINIPSLRLGDPAFKFLIFQNQRAARFLR